MWTADWWKEQQSQVGPYEKILALIIYVDETNVTFNGRNVHPVYISLGNLHVDFRLVLTLIAIDFELIDVQEQTCWEEATRIFADSGCAHSVSRIGSRPALQASHKSVILGIRRSTTA